MIREDRTSGCENVTLHLADPKYDAESSTYKLVLDIRTKPPLLANRMLYAHWTRARKEKLRWLQLVGAHTAGKRPKEPLQRAAIRAVRRSSRAPDPDCQGTGFKWILDALTHFRVIEDDSAKHITFDCSWEYARGADQGIHVTVTEIAPV